MHQDRFVFPIRLICSLCVCFLLSSCIRRSAEVEPERSDATNEGTFLVLSDLHFNPFYDPAIFPQLVRRDARDWHLVFESSEVDGLGNLGEDLAYPLFASGLDAMRATLPNPDFVLVPGDFLVHHFAAKHHHLRHEAGLEFADGTVETHQEFAVKTMRFLAHEIQRRFPETPILPVLGNNDSVCGNYRFEPSSSFLADLGEVWSGFLPDQHHRESFLHTFPKLGHYTLEAPQGDFRLIVLNTVVWSWLYKNTCGSSVQDPAEETLVWLEGQLEKAKRQKRQVWLVFHIPPGIDAYETLKRAEKAGGEIHPAHFWREEYHHRFVDLVVHYREQLRATIAAHIHRNSFQLLGHRGQDNGGSSAYVRLVPALSPVYGNNPAFKTFHYDRHDGYLIDYAVHHFDLASPADGWHHEHSFNKIYGHPRIDVESLEAIYYEMLEDPREMLKYIEYHKVSSPTAEIDEENWPVYWSTIGHLEVEPFKYWHRQLTSEEPVEDHGN